MKTERELFLYELDGHGYTFENMKWLGNCFEDNFLNMAYEMWCASASREGYVVVPKEPTQQMTVSGDNAVQSNRFTVVGDIYKAMIEAVEK